jgi:hypothetical protein
MKSFGISLALPFLLALFASVKGECGAPATVTQLDFFDSTLVSNTLHQSGGELRYQGASTGVVLNVFVHTTAFGRYVPPKNLTSVCSPFLFLVCFDVFDSQVSDPSKAKT